MDFLPESVAHGRFEVHSDFMNDSGPGGGGFFWCLRDNRVEALAILRVCGHAEAICQASNCI